MVDLKLCTSLRLVDATVTAATCVCASNGLAALVLVHRRTRIARCRLLQDSFVLSA